MMSKKLCSLCEHAHYGRGWCEKHYRRWYDHGDPLYVKVPKRYKQVGTSGNEQRLHRVVAGCVKGDGKVVHHIDRNRLNNDPSNLLVLPSKAAHRLLHIAEDGAR